VDVVQSQFNRNTTPARPPSGTQAREAKQHGGKLGGKTMQGLGIINFDPVFGGRLRAKKQIVNVGGNAPARLRSKVNGCRSEPVSVSTLHCSARAKLYSE
jgi:hypothetical protein